MTAKRDSEGKIILTAFQKGMSIIIIGFLSAIVWLCYVNTGVTSGHEVTLVNHAKQIENNTRGEIQIRASMADWKTDNTIAQYKFQNIIYVKMDSILRYLNKQDRLLKRICKKINIPNTYNDILGCKKDSVNLITIKN